MCRILIVDDEPNILSALRRELHGCYEIATHVSPVDALQQSREQPFDLVISDYRMPQMNGVRFLKRFAEIQPDAARVLLSGQSDVDMLLRAINETHIYRFIAKPWEAVEVRACIGQALAHRKLVLQYRHLAVNYGSRRNAAGPGPLRSYHVILVTDGNGLLMSLWNGMARRGADGGLYRALLNEIAPNAPDQYPAFSFFVNAFTTAADALEYAACGAECDLVISPLTLPDGDGIAVLSAFREARPEAARILVNDQAAELDTVVRALNEAQVHAFLNVASWDAAALKDHLTRRSRYLDQFRSGVLQAITDRELLRATWGLAVREPEPGRVPR